MAKVSINEPLRADTDYMLVYEKPSSYRLWGTEQAALAATDKKLLIQGLYSEGTVDPGIHLEGYTLTGDRIQIYFRTSQLFQDWTPASLRFTLIDLDNGLYYPLKLLEAEIFVYPPAEMIAAGLTIWGKDLSVLKPERVEATPEYHPEATKAALTTPSGEPYPTKKEVVGIMVPKWEEEPTPPPEKKGFPWKWVLLGAFIFGALVSVKTS